jgi:transposase, IS30 family
VSRAWAADHELRAVVQNKLELECSREQISAWLRHEHRDQPSWHVCHETIYQGFITLPEAAWAGSSPRSFVQVDRYVEVGDAPASERFRFVAPARLITRVVSSRIRVGDWERDLIMGRGKRSAIGHSSSVEAVTSFLCSYQPVTVPRQYATRSETLMALPEQIRRTLTWDQGSEIACHDEIAHLLSAGVST